MTETEKKPAIVIHGTFANLTPEERFRVFLLRNAQMVVAEDLLPAIRQAVDNFVSLYPQKAGNEHRLFRRYVTINIVDELVKYLSQDARATFHYVTPAGDRTAVNYDNLDSESAKLWFTRVLFGEDSDGMSDWCPTLKDVHNP